MRKGNARFPKVGALISIASTSFLEISPVLCLIYRGVFFFFSYFAQSSSWPRTKTVVKKWLNLKNEEFHSDCISKLSSQNKMDK